MTTSEDVKPVTDEDIREVIEAACAKCYGCALPEVQLRETAKDAVRYKREAVKLESLRIALINDATASDARAEQAERERDAARERLRDAAQVLIEAIGSVGPENAEEAARRAADRIATFEASLASERECRNAAARAFGVQEARAEAAERERDALREAAIAVLVDGGPCDWSESDPPGLCDRADCSYCALDRVLSPATATKVG